MSRSESERLDDMREECDRIGRLVARGRAAFDGDEAVRLAVERSLEIIGEAANMIGDETRGRHSDVDWRRITRFRIVLAHHYHRVDPDQVWTIAVDHVPALAKALGPLDRPETG
ncbi:MAG TPA: HepT-like ribonuclease domain-containing protein [Acidimicrobiales bacterium]